jgi:translation initiation factor 5
MALLNIGAANSDDAFYRYKMPKMVTKIEGRGNGIKTNIVNMVDVAKALGRPASYTTKYFGCELGAQSKFDPKTGTSLVNGAHDTAKLADLLENFIKKYVQCYGCGNPETDILISKTQMISLKCAACGFISDVDMRDKLTGFIVKNPPEVKKGKDKKALRRAEKERLKEGEAIDEEQRKLKKESKKKATTAATKTSKKKANGSDEEHSSPGGSQAGDADVVAEEDGDDVEWQTDTSAAAAQQRMKEQLSAVTAEMVVLTTTEERKPPASKPEKKDVVSKTVSEIKTKLKEGMKPSELKSYVGNLGGSTQEIMNAVVEALFGGAGKGFAKEVMKKKPYFMAVVNDEESQMQLLRAIEFVCGKCSAETLKELAFGAKYLYDADLLEEEIIVKWYGEGVTGANKGSPIWKNMKPFVEWLQNAESESEEE